LDNQISQVHHRALGSAEPFLLEVTRRAKERLVEEGTDPEYGARPLKRVVEKRIVTPVSHYICSDQIRRGDLVMIDHDGDGFLFLKEPGIDWDRDEQAGRVTAAGKWARTDLGVRDDGGEKKKMVEEAGHAAAPAEVLTGAFVD
ncbi:hypothetical protein HGA89_03830, partial [bacterium]|nr:hypothetical protein [bacterium]